MDSEQLKLLKEYGGPIFEAGPGWGFKIKKWLGKNLAGRILPVIAVLVLAWGLFVIIKAQTAKHANTTAQPDKIFQIVSAGDSGTLVARKALSAYLKLNPDAQLNPGQRIFIENVLSKEVSGKLAAGEKKEFDVNTIKTLVSEAKNLSATQLSKWEAYSRGIKFE